VDLLVILMDSQTNQLLPPSDETIWEQEGFFDQIDLLSARHQSFPAKTPLSNKPFSIPVHTHTSSEELDNNIHTAGGSRSPLLPLPTAFPKATHTVLRAPAGRKAWKAKKKISRLVLGDGVGFENLCKMSTCSLVGRLSYKSLCTQKMADWIITNWVPLIGYSPEVLYLKSGWLGFHCRTPEDSTLLLSSFWVFDGSSLMVKRWRLEFNPDTEYFQLRHLWVLLPGLPLHLWNEESYRAIGDSLGRFIALDSKLLDSPSRKMGKVLVEMDITTGLPETLEISW